MVTFSSSLTYFTVLLPQSPECGYNIMDDYWHLHLLILRNTLIYAHKTSRTFPTCGNNLDLLRMHAPEAEDAVEFLVP
jgi:hypothetical protein